MSIPKPSSPLSEAVGKKKLKVNGVDGAFYTGAMSMWPEGAGADPTDTTKGKNSSRCARGVHTPTLEWTCATNLEEQHLDKD